MTILRTTWSSIDIITDPPRDGMHKDVVVQIFKIAPEKK
jgi:tRNA/tmRNA/rRNA uracil-C5-methylase (TrmA/RlmC/RlmD family)